MPAIEIYQMQKGGEIPERLWRKRRSIAYLFHTRLADCLGTGDRIFVSEDSQFPFLAGHSTIQHQYIEKLLPSGWTYHPNTLQIFRDPPGWVGSYWIASDEQDNAVQFYFFVADFKGVYLQWGNA